jgi:hypothetical protein
MRSCSAAAVALWLVAHPVGAMAQVTCVTAFGSCPIGSAVGPGGQCFCVTPKGPVTGTVVGQGSGPTDAFPHFCCTPSGRMGPYPNQSALPGQLCQAVLPSGSMMEGQACF